jgi:3-methylfumaryl-CoA hydratase
MIPVVLDLRSGWGMGTETLDIADYSDRVRIEEDEVSLALCRRTAALLDLESSDLVAGATLPLGWAAILFPGVARQSEIGEDGHPRRGDFLPPIALPRRRFAGRSVELFTPLRIGERIERRSTIAEVAHKEGRSGPLAFVTIQHEISNPTGLAMIERQNVAYLGLPRPDERSTPPRPSADLPRPDWEVSFTPDPVMLFRYSALTFNGHRIHYDRVYATEMEGYPALVANGGLTTLLLLEMARTRLGRPVTGYEVRAIRPLFEGQTASLRGALTGESAVFWAIDQAGELAMRIDVKTG